MERHCLPTITSLPAAYQHSSAPKVLTIKFLGGRHTVLYTFCNALEGYCLPAYQLLTSFPVHQKCSPCMSIIFFFGGGGETCLPNQQRTLNELPTVHRLLHESIRWLMLVGKKERCVPIIKSIARTNGKEVSQEVIDSFKVGEITFPASHFQRGKNFSDKHLVDKAKHFLGIPPTNKFHVLHFGRDTVRTFFCCGGFSYCIPKLTAFPWLLTSLFAPPPPPTIPEAGRQDGRHGLRPELLQGVQPVQDAAAEAPLHPDDRLVGAGDHPVRLPHPQHHQPQLLHLRHLHPVLSAGAAGRPAGGLGHRQSGQEERRPDGTLQTYKRNKL